MSGTRAIAAAIRAAARPLDGSPRDLDEVLRLVGDAHLVMIGESSHGTHEFYRVRAEITKRLIREKGFRAIAVEADWPDAYRVGRFVLGRGDDADATEALAGFERFPQWMWRNADVLDFVGWLRANNDALDPARRVGFYGLDLYSLHRSMDAVLAYLRLVDPEAEERARSRYACFDHFGEDPQAYGYAASFGVSPTCEGAVLAQLVELQRSRAEYARRDGRLDPDHTFHAEENARVVVDAERYYRSMFSGREESWNVRDRHMMAALEAVERHVAGPSGARGKVVVWAHNSHLGDARSTDMSLRGELNLGQLVRERWGRASFSIGFSTFAGTVTAADDWGGAAERMTVRDARAGSWERLLHDLALGNVLVDLAAVRDTATPAPRLLERAIGVVYRPRTELQSHYFRADLPRQFDVMLHYDRTRAVEPLERTASWERGELPETYPSAL